MKSMVVLVVPPIPPVMNLPVTILKEQFEAIRKIVEDCMSYSHFTVAEKEIDQFICHRLVNNIFGYNPYKISCCDTFFLLFLPYPYMSYQFKTAQRCSHSG